MLYCVLYRVQYLLAIKDRMFPFCGSICTNYCLMSWCVYSIGHGMFQRGRGCYTLIVVVVEYIWVCVLLIIKMHIFLLLGRMWGHVYLQNYHSFVISVYLNYICGIVQIYSVIEFSFQCVVFLTFGRLCHMCVCVSCVEYMLGVFWLLFVCFYGVNIFFI
jgi:hypothetical protein